MIQFCSVRPADAASYQHHHAQFMSALQEKVGEFSWYADKFSPYPLLLDEADMATFERLRGAIDRAIVQVVNAYADDPRLSAIIELPPSHLQLLARANRRTYQTGSFRPDLLLGSDGVWRVCEINARFPINGYLSSYYINRFVGNLDYLSGCGARPVSEMNGLLDAILGHFSYNKPLILLRDIEKGMDTHLLAAELKQRGLSLRVRKPSELTVRDGVIFDQGEVVDQFILELERDELLNMRPELFEAMANCPSYFNDMRTLLLAHDKRMLAILSDVDIMADYVDKTDQALLARHILPTYPASDSRIATGLRNCPEKWVLKRNSSGRGIDMLIGSECEIGLWRLTLMMETGDYTAQRYLHQRTLPVYTVEDGELRQRAMQVVAMLPGFNGQSFGPGFFRAGLDSIINVAGGRGEIIPAMLSS
jgi:hypothetical protein